MTDLFPDIPGGPISKGRLTPRGYAAIPGTGPDGETCRSCASYVHVGKGRQYAKCELMRHNWTHGPGTDILARSPACARWESAQEDKIPW